MTIEVVPYSPELAPHFERLNVEWIEAFFRVETIDLDVLQHPQEKVIDAGGEILFALDGEAVLGCVALKHEGEGVFELTKMAVTPAAQGRGLGRILMNACIERFEAREGTYLYLESHDSLTPALTLYESVGFRHTARPGGPSPYARANVYMVYSTPD
ncbi:MAG: GNAT family N-acetyltransferase [Pseudomonadota bacterium]